MSENPNLQSKLQDFSVRGAKSKKIVPTKLENLVFLYQCFSFSSVFKIFACKNSRLSGRDSGRGGSPSPRRRAPPEDGTDGQGGFGGEGRTPPQDGTDGRSLLTGGGVINWSQGLIRSLFFVFLNPFIRESFTRANFGSG